MCTFSGTLTKDFFAPFTLDFEAWCLGIEWRATASEREKENRVKRVLDCFGTLLFTLLAVTVAQENWFLIRPPKHSHKAVRHNTDSVLRGHHYWACLRSWRVFGIFIPFMIRKIRVAAARKLNRRRTRPIELFLKAISEMPRASVSKRG